MSTRRLRYFVAVADELHFSRAAAKLFVSQQALSKQIQELENAIGTPLLVRSTRSVELTSAGQAFLPACRDVLARLNAGVEAVRATGSGQRGTLRLGFFVLAALELTTPILTQFSATHPDVTVVMHEYTYNDPSAGLADESSDLAIVRLPIALPDLCTEPLFSEPRVVAVAANHPLAGRDRISVEELAGERMTSATNDDPAFRRFWGLEEFLHTPAPPAIQTTSHAEELEVVATGRACSITAACAARFAPHTAVRFIPIDDVPPAVTALAWRPPAESPLTREFVAVASAVRDREADLVRAIEHPWAERSGP